MVNQAEIHIELDGGQSFSDAEKLYNEVQTVINSKFPTIERVLVIPYSYSNVTNSNTEYSKKKLLREIKLKRPSLHTNRNKKEELSDDN